MWRVPGLISCSPPCSLPCGFVCWYSQFLAIGPIEWGTLWSTSDIFFSPRFSVKTHLCHVEMPAGCKSSELTMAGCVTCAVCRGSNVFVTDTWPPIVRLGDFGSALKAPPTEVRKVGGKGAEQMTLSIKVSIAGGVWSMPNVSKCQVLPLHEVLKRLSSLSLCSPGAGCAEIVWTRSSTQLDSPLASWKRIRCVDWFRNLFLNFEVSKEGPTEDDETSEYKPPEAGSWAVLWQHGAVNCWVLKTSCNGSVSQSRWIFFEPWFHHHCLIATVHCCEKMIQQVASEGSLWSLL